MTRSRIALPPGGRTDLPGHPVGCGVNRAALRFLALPAPGASVPGPMLVHRRTIPKANAMSRAEIAMLWWGKLKRGDRIQVPWETGAWVVRKATPVGDEKEGFQAILVRRAP